MKYLFSFTALLLFCFSGFSQNQPSLQEQLEAVYENLNKSQLVTGYLYDQAVPLVSPARYRGTVNADNAADINRFGAVFGHIMKSNTMGGGYCLTQVIT